ncbi:MAG TPA: hypothetical protein P5108_05525 [Marmoricola sp.]|nr:hypothetical protein [Nocardioidaceae bacterium]MCB8993182.1 hypothetical protein [Nocardioidaceae bacterium]MCO5323110.1 hypothetical protein [Nocardioidaceae bacterium]HMY08684.1 hypothetical protein [Marmoricola sp.]HRV68892.1 hypothetical protein [Marmoricola sp.]
MRRGLVLGCGGPVGFAWSAVALDELERALGWVGQAIAASWVIPGWFPPVQIGARTLTDGGAPARGLAHAERLLRRPMTKRVDREQGLLEDHGIKVVRIEPGVEELQAMGPNFMDTRARSDTLLAARQQLPARIQTQLETKP